MFPLPGAILAASLPLLALASFDCRPPGPIVPRPMNIASHPTFLSATSDLTKILQGAVSGEIEPGWPVENTSFSLGLITRDQPDKKIPIWEHHFLAPNNVRGTKEITRDSEYLINSITKVFSDYILLRSGLPLDDPVSKYVPKLKTNSSNFDWDSITLRHLANGFAGLPPSYGFFENYALKPYFESLGFPHVEDNDYQPCGVIALNGPCSTDQLLEGISDLHPVAKLGAQPAYSNLVYYLFTLAIQESTGKNYTQLLRELVTEPYGLSSTRASPGDDSRAVIPPITNLWGVDYAHHVPGAGLVSTLSDLSVFFHSILDRSIMDKEIDVLAWLKPTSSTGSLYTLVGMPWEIYRTHNLTPKHPHTIDLYGKGGGAAGYRSQATVIDEYGVAIVLLTAGPPKALNSVYNAALTTLIPAIDEIAREQARKYTGTFTDSHSESSVGLNLTITQDENSIIIAGLERNGTDMLESYRTMFYLNIGESLDMLPIVPRIYPADITTNATTKYEKYNDKSVIREEWRLDWELLDNTATTLPGADLGKNDCLNWIAGDWVYWASESLDRLVFVRDASTGVVKGIEMPALRSGLLRKV